MRLAALIASLLAGCTCPKGVADPVNGVTGPDGNPIVAPDMRPIPKSPNPWDELRKLEPSNPTKRA